MQIRGQECHGEGIILLYQGIKMFSLPNPGLFRHTCGADGGKRIPNLVMRRSVWLVSLVEIILCYITAPKPRIGDWYDIMVRIEHGPIKSYDLRASRNIYNCSKGICRMIC